MKLQNLIIIFIIIIIPIVLIFSLYLNLETKTIMLQTDYDEKLIEATKEAVEAFEVNTVEWNSEYSSLANAKRQDLTATINVFITSLASKLGIGGTSRENILTYVPAIVFTMYDGYYIYSPTYVPQTMTDANGVQLFYYEDAGSEGAKVTISATQNIGGTIVAGEPIYVLDDGTATGNYNGTTFTTNIENANKIYKHVLKTFVPYTKKYEFNGESYVINYTLDNYVRVYGEDKTREGYIIDNFSESKITIPVNEISGIKFDSNSITLETLSENIAIKDTSTGTTQVTTFDYIYNSNNDKRYYDSIKGKYFTLNKDNVQVYLPNVTVGSTLAEYKKILILPSATSSEYLELYQLLNGTDNAWYYIDSNNQYVKYATFQHSISKNEDCSAINYYVETYSFNKWLRETSGLDLDEDEIQDIINGKDQAIIENINNNLNLSMSNYSSNSSIDYKLPELTEEDWKQALSNMSMITFFQGTKIGLKTYNNYVVVTSTENNEYVNEDSLYYIGQAGDNYYHRYCCSKGTPLTSQYVYRNTEFNKKSYDDNGNTKYYHKHNGTSGEVYECFDCIVNRNNFEEQTSEGLVGTYKKAHYTALARERYVQMERTRLTDT